MYNIDEIKNKIICGDCLEELKKFPDNSIDTIITDPPYGLGFMGKKWDKNGIAFNVNLWKECLRVLKPGGHLLSFGGTRTYHRMACAIEDAGFEIRDMLEWIYREGFPKSLNIAKAYDKKMGKKIENKSEFTEFSKKTNTTKHIRRYKRCKECGKLLFGQDYCKCDWRFKKRNNKFDGLGTALKPAHEPICMAMKPLSEKTFVDNIVKWGTGGLQIDECRIPIKSEYEKKHLKDIAIGQNNSTNGKFFGGKGKSLASSIDIVGRFPANVLCQDDALNDGEITKSGHSSSKLYQKYGGQWGKGRQIRNADFGDIGSKSRYFDIDKWNEKHGLLQFPKASKKERDMGLEEFEIVEVRGGGGRVKNGYNDNDPEQKRLKNAAREFGAIKTAKHNIHPTVKPLSLMRYLCRLITPPKGIVLDMFAGSGSTLIAAKQEGFNFIGIEKESEYVAIAEARIKSIPESLF